VFAFRQKPSREATQVFVAVAKYLSGNGSQQNSTGLAWQYQQTQLGLRKPARPLPQAGRTLEVGGSGGTGRREVQRSTGRGTGHSSAVAVAVAVAVCGPSLDLGWNNCNRLGNRRREP
jgi:hypothetical protein